MASVSFKNVSLEFPIYGSAKSRSIKHKLLSFGVGCKLSGDQKTPCIKALTDLTFELKPGDRVGLVGHNGAGKSTLLRMLTGIYYPTSGYSKITGRVNALLDLFLGLDPELSGIENIKIRSKIMGVSKEYLNKLIEEVANFTELGEYLALPVRTYSTGMSKRLAFGLSTAISSGILLLDEVIGTGDESFQVKARARLEKFLNKAEIVVVSSHDSSVIKDLCNKAILLEHGKLVRFGGVEEVLEEYSSFA